MTLIISSLAVTLYIYMFSGLYDAVNDETIKYDTIERLLQSWCKTNVYRDSKVIDLAKCAIIDGRDEMYTELLTKCKTDNEFAHAVLAGNSKLIQKLGKKGMK